MVKKGKVRIMITLKEEDVKRLDLLEKYLDIPKSKIISNLINQKTSIKKMFNEVDYTKLDPEDKLYYVKWLFEKDYLYNNTLYPIKDLINDCIKISFQLLSNERDKCGITEKSRELSNMFNDFRSYAGSKRLDFKELEEMIGDRKRYC